MTVVPQFARYRAPAESGHKVSAPPWPELGALVAANRAWRATTEIRLLDRPLVDVSREARRDLLARAASYVASYHPAIAAASFDPDRPLVVTGHQPGLVHPGVWLKNFAAGDLANAQGGVAVHVIIDADVCRRASMLVPAGTVAAPQLAPVEFDRGAPPTPWEERGILDGELWRSFPHRVRATGAGLVRDPYLDQWWPAAVERSGATRRIGASFAQARHAAEIDWGCRNLELPQSQACQLPAFRLFACHIMGQIREFAAAYNASLAEYRRAHGIRNHAHPVPNLATDGEWSEAPFWLWSVDDPRRRAVFVRRRPSGVTLTDRHEFSRELPLVDGSADLAIETLASWESEGVKLRSRALTTTMFLRLVVADLFIHGIGGAKYDEAVDRVCERFFGLAPPAYAMLSGTLRLPIDHAAGGDDEIRALRRRLREYEFHPDRAVERAALAPVERAQAEALIRDKHAWIDEAKTPQNAATRHAGIMGANAALQPFVAAARQIAQRDLAAAVARARANRVLDSREFAFCLFSRERLEQFLLDFGS